MRRGSRRHELTELFEGRSLAAILPARLPRTSAVSVLTFSLNLPPFSAPKAISLLKYSTFPLTHAEQTKDMSDSSRKHFQQNYGYPRDSANTEPTGKDQPKNLNTPAGKPCEQRSGEDLSSHEKLLLKHLNFSSEGTQSAASNKDKDGSAHAQGPSISTMNDEHGSGASVDEQTDCHQGSFSSEQSVPEQTKQSSLKESAAEGSKWTEQDADSTDDEEEGGVSLQGQ